MLHKRGVNGALPHGGAHITEKAADVLQQRTLMLVVCLGRQAVGRLMLSAEQPAKRIDDVIRPCIPLQYRPPQAQHQPLPLGNTAPRDEFKTSYTDCLWCAGNPGRGHW